MSDALMDAVAMLDIDAISAAAAHESRTAIEGQLGRRLPNSVARLLQFPGLMGSVATVYESDPEFPASLRFVDRTKMPGAGDDILWLMTENQGVCWWGVPLGAGDDPPVLVGGDPLESGASTATFAKSVGEFVLAMAWDKNLMSHDLLIQAQADPIDQETLRSLDSRYSERVRTLGWPAMENRRYEGPDGLLLSIWSGVSQCDWYIAAAAPAPVKEAVAWLRLQSNLEQALWSNDKTGMDLLARLGVQGPSGGSHG